MIEGEFNSQGQLIFVIDLVDANSEHIPVNALLDTGFDYWLAMNNQDIESLGAIASAVGVSAAKPLALAKLPLADRTKNLRAIRL